MFGVNQGSAIWRENTSRNIANSANQKPERGRLSRGGGLFLDLALDRNFRRHKSARRSWRCAEPSAGQPSFVGRIRNFHSISGTVAVSVSNPTSSHYGPIMLRLLAERQASMNGVVTRSKAESNGNDGFIVINSGVGATVSFIRQRCVQQSGIGWLFDRPNWSDADNRRLNRAEMIAAAFYWKRKKGGDLWRQQSAGETERSGERR
jgi:hypothetical protein